MIYRTTPNLVFKVTPFFDTEYLRASRLTPGCRLTWRSKCESQITWLRQPKEESGAHGAARVVLCQSDVWFLCFSCLKIKTDKHKHELTVWRHKSCEDWRSWFLPRLVQCTCSTKWHAASVAKRPQSTQEVTIFDVCTHFFPYESCVSEQNSYQCNQKYELD